MLTATKYDGLVEALRQRMNRKRVGRYRRLSFDAIRNEIDHALFAPGTEADDGGHYGKGQSFGHACDQCGACCRQLGIPIKQADLDREPKLVPLVVLEGEEKTPYLACGPKRPCPALDGNRCSIQASKPKVCSSTPPGSFCCQYSRRQEGLPSLPRGV